MKIVKRVALAAGIAAALIMIPTQVANAYWPGAPPVAGPWRNAYVHDPAYRQGPVAGPWRNAYVHDPAYRWGSPVMKQYIRDLYLRGPGYANWRQQRR
jgi:hypothetical protein